MKKLLLSLSCLFIFFFSYSQTEIAKYSSAGYTIYLSQYDKDVILDSLMELLGYSGCSLDSAVIDDQDPFATDSAAYIVFYATCSEIKKSFAMGCYLTKVLNHGEIKYRINNNSLSVSRAWNCETAPECSHCGPVRNWFLGPVVDCDCDTCKFSTSGSGMPWEGILTLLNTILNLLG